MKDSSNSFILSFMLKSSVFRDYSSWSIIYFTLSDYFTTKGLFRSNFKGSSKWPTFRNTSSSVVIEIP